jgi:hypothetical protein
MKVTPLLLFLLWSGIAHGDPCTPTVSDLLCIPMWFLTIPDLSARALRQLPAEISSSEAGRTGREMAVEFCLQMISFILVGLFNMT